METKAMIINKILSLVSELNEYRAKLGKLDTVNTPNARIHVQARIDQYMRVISELDQMLDDNQGDEDEA